MADAYELLGEMWLRDPKSDVISFSAAVSGCEKGTERVLPIEPYRVMREWNETGCEVLQSQNQSV